MLGNNIVLTPEPRGRRLEAYNDSGGDLLPGTVVQLKSGSTEDAGGRLGIEAYNQSGSGVPKVIWVLDFDYLQGKTADDAIKDGKRCFIYCPLPGDELNMLVQDQSGTGATSDFSVGDPLKVEDGTGLLIDGALGTSGIANPFEVMENYANMTADTRLHVQFTGV